MTELNFLRFWGDSAALTMAMVHPDTGAVFDPAGYNLLFTVKRSLDQIDADAMVQKLSTVGGIAVVVGAAVVSLVPADWTKFKPDLCYYYSLKAIKVSNGAALTVSAGRLSGRGVAGRGVALSVDTVIVTPAAALGQSFRDLASFDDLADLDLTEIPTPFLFGVTVGDSNMQWWRVRAIGPGEVTDGAEIIVSHTDPTRVFFRVG